MPFYCFACPSCGHAETVRRPMARSQDPAPCPKCPGAVAMNRDMQAEAAGGKSEYLVWSQQLGIHPSQIKDHQRAHPDIPVRADGAVGIRSARDVERICGSLGGEAAGWTPR
jgi:putative FmdB family regulatory protein